MLRARTALDRAQTGATKSGWRHAFACSAAMLICSTSAGYTPSPNSMVGVQPSRMQGTAIVATAMQPCGTAPRGHEHSTSSRMGAMLSAGRRQARPRGVRATRPRTPTADCEDFLRLRAIFNRQKTDVQSKSTNTCTPSGHQ